MQVGLTDDGSAAGRKGPTPLRPPAPPLPLGLLPPLPLGEAPFCSSCSSPFPLPDRHRPSRLSMAARLTACLCLVRVAGVTWIEDVSRMD